jgi:hypothetical protein
MHDFQDNKLKPVKKGPNLWIQPERMQRVAEEVRLGLQKTIDAF